MFKKVVNSMMLICLAAVTTFSWGELIFSGNSLFFFGEPEYPSEK